MGNTPPSAQSIREYEVAFKKYEEDCAAMEAEEAAARSRSAPDELTLATYFCIQGAALCCEVPCRTTWHGSCVGCHMCCCLPCAQVSEYFGAAICACQIGILRIAQFHFDQMMGYLDVCQFLALNLWHPCDPHYVYAPDVSISRPPRPTPPSNGFRTGGLCDLCSCFCDCRNIYNCNSDAFQQRMASLHNRDIRSKLCFLSLWNWCDCMEAFHLATCLGPWPCLSETYEERMARWNTEYNVKKEVRTAEFWRLRECSVNRYSFCRSESGTLNASIVESVDEGSFADELVPCARGLVGAVMGLACAASCIGVSSLLFSLSLGGSGVSSASPLLTCVTQPVNQIKLACCGSMIGGASGLYGVGGKCRGPRWLSCCLKSGRSEYVQGIEYNPFSVFDHQDEKRDVLISTSFGRSPDTLVMVRPQTSDNTSLIVNYGSVMSEE